jgi:hypothetical protein
MVEGSGFVRSAKSLGKWAVVELVIDRNGISTEVAIVLPDDCHQAGVFRHDVPEHMRGLTASRSARGLEVAAPKGSRESSGRPGALNTAKRSS